MGVSVEEPLPIVSCEEFFPRLGLNLSERAAIDEIGRGSRGIGKRVEMLARGFTDTALEGDTFALLRRSYFQDNELLDIREYKRKELWLAHAMATHPKSCDPLRTFLTCLQLEDILNQYRYKQTPGTPEAILKVIAREQYNRIRGNFDEARSSVVQSFRTGNYDRSIVLQTLVDYELEELTLDELSASIFGTRLVHADDDRIYDLDSPSMTRGSHGYVPTPFGTTLHMLRHTDLTPGRRFVDLGGGVGGVVYPVAMFSPFEAVSCELNENLIAAGHQVGNVFTPRLNVQFVQKNLLQDPIPEADIYFIYNPFFDEKQLQRFVAKLARELEGRNVVIWAHDNDLLSELGKPEYGFQKIGQVGDLSVFIPHQDPTDELEKLTVSPYLADMPL